MTAMIFEEALDDLIDGHLASSNSETWDAVCDEICSALKSKLMALREAQCLQAGGSTREERDICWAVKQLQLGERLCRRSWIAEGMYIALKPRLQQPASAPLDCQPYIAMFTKTAPPGYWDQWGRWQPGQWGHWQEGWWVCSQSDLLATDWELVFGDD